MSMKNIFHDIFADTENKLENGGLNDRLELLNKVFEYWNVHILNTDDEVVEQHLKILYQLIEYFRNQGIKKKDDKLTHENYLCRKLNKLADHLLVQYDEEYSKFKDYTMLNEYGRSMNTKRELGISYDEVEEHAGDTYLSDTMLKGLEVHIDMIEQYTSKNVSEFEDVYKFSEDEKKKIRDEYVKEKLDQSPLLEKMFNEWLRLGEMYGFTEKDKEKRDEIQNFWIEKFKNEKHLLTPKQRMYRLRKMYNDLGYELFKIAESISNPTAVKNTDSNFQDDQFEQAIENVFDLGDPRHVAGLLTIQRDEKGNFHPIFVMLEEKHKEHIDSPIRHIIDEFKNVLKFADLSNIERDIVDLIIQEPKIMKEAQRFADRNPYIMIIKYINNKYGLYKTKRDIIHMIEKKISRIIANTYIDLKNEVGLKKCTYCSKEKLASLNNFGRDLRNKSGLKSICKKCASKKEKLRSKIS